ncbi:hypothetical protein AALP_AA7G276200 [Arabis alpina]|uniref:Late embryogenesis abundant protein LEA-2 subgroup domain-containing protein n=1 Tax=Arabis alpina TaxID=50452 RepID=A0A087GKZ5_ARAAL|nr:hypothetical protein AALP_AA7G276200 [Arabis alpina]
MEEPRVPPTSTANDNKDKPAGDPPSTSHRPTNSLPHIPTPTSQVSSPPPHFRQHSLNLFPSLSSSPPPPDPTPEIDTYVVQVPRDQVHWTPPPENATIVERLVVIGVIMCAVALIIRSVYKPEPPAFDVKKFVKSQQYEIMLTSKNPTANMWVTFKGLVSLTYENQILGQGNFPEMSQPTRGFDAIDLKLDSSKNVDIVLPLDVVSLVLTMKLNAGYGTGLVKRTKEVVVSCDIKVNGLLDAEGDVEIVSESCESAFIK